ncbi:MAG: alanine racemase [bacterium]
MTNLGNKSWVEINATALRSNIGALRSALNPGAQFCAVVKANAYGHGLEPIVRLASLEGIAHFAADSVDEAMAVRRLAPNATIFILGFSVPERFTDIITNRLIQTVYRAEQVNLIAQKAAEIQSQALVNIKIETGTNRQGIPENQIPDLIRAIKKNERALTVVGVSSHLSDSENTDDQSIVRNQLDRFRSVVSALNASGINPKFAHIACSAAAMLQPDAHFNMARFGIAMYGLWPSESLRKKMRISGKIDLKPVMSLQSVIAQVKDIAAGDFIGYSRGFRADRPMRIAVLPIGYYDGYRRAYEGADVLIHGQRCRNVGHICMNMTMVDVSAIAQVSAGDHATLIGRDGMNQISAEDLAGQAGTINYEVVTSIGAHLPKIVI